MSSDDFCAVVVVVEDQTVVRDALAFVFAHQPGYGVAWAAGTVEEARRWAGTKHFDVAIVDLGLPDGEGTDVIRELRAEKPSSLVVAVSASSDNSTFARAVAAGASAYLDKMTPLTEILSTVERLLRGESVMTVGQVATLMRHALDDQWREQARPTLPALTNREREVLAALADGLSDREIAARLFIAYDTVRAHLGHIMIKLGAASRLQAVLIAGRQGLVDLS